jgi:predicted DNA-binding protein (MmcQ/YjbR family)
MASYIEWVRAFCLSLPHATEDVQWEHDLLFRIAGKMFCVANMEPQLVPTKIAFKCTPDKFAELVEVEGIIPAPYMARNHWVAIIEMDAMRQPEFKELIRESYRLVLEKLPKKTQGTLSITPSTKAPAKKAKARTKTKAGAKTKAKLQIELPRAAKRKK